MSLKDRLANAGHGGDVPASVERTEDGSSTPGDGERPSQPASALRTPETA